MAGEPGGLLTILVDVEQELSTLDDAAGNPRERFILCRQGQLHFSQMFRLVTLIHGSHSSAQSDALSSNFNIDAVALADNSQNESQSLPFRGESRHRGTGNRAV